MHAGPVILINANRMQPPVAPIALDYLGSALQTAGFEVELIDLAFASDPETDIRGRLAEVDPLLIGMTLRNTDDCFWPSAQCFVPEFAQLVQQVKHVSEAPVVIGGCGYSIFAQQILERCDADWGMTGDGETGLTQLARALREDRDVETVPGLVFRQESGSIAINPPAYNQTLSIPPTRQLIDNHRYLQKGAMGNIETKRGCPMECIYCADPVAKGHKVRRRPPEQVADEIEALLSQGVDMLHICDGEFNIPASHAIEVCEAITARGLDSRIQWYAYATVHPFPKALATAMKRAGCVGINFGADSASPAMLKTLKRGYAPSAIRDAVTYCRQEGITVMLDLLLGGPGETPETVRSTIDFVKSLDFDRCGAATGIRLYPHTLLAEQIIAEGMETNANLHGQLTDNNDLLEPVFYISQHLGRDAGALVCDVIGHDERFFPPPRLKDATNYNYNDNQVLQDAIDAGARGAFWDILRQL